MTLTDNYINLFAEQQEYENSLKHYRDLKNVTDAAFEEGKAEGKAEGKLEGKEEGLAEGLEKGKEEGKAEKAWQIARSALAEGATDAFIARITGLSIAEIAALRDSL